MREFNQINTLPGTSFVLAPMSYKYLLRLLYRDLNQINPLVVVAQIVDEVTPNILKKATQQFFIKEIK